MNQGSTRYCAALREADMTLTWACSGHVHHLHSRCKKKNWQMEFLCRPCLDLGEWTLHPKFFQVFGHWWGMSHVIHIEQQRWIGLLPMLFWPHRISLTWSMAIQPLLTPRDREGVHSGGPCCTKLAPEDVLLRHIPALVDSSGPFMPPTPRASVPPYVSLTDFNSRGLSGSVIPTLLKSNKSTCHKLPLHLEGLFCLLQVEELSS